MFKISAIIMFVAISGFASSALAQERWEIPEYKIYGAPSKEADAIAIDTLLETFRKAWEAEDAATVAGLHSDNVEWINAYARMFQSSDALEQFLEKRLFPAFRASASESESRNMKSISRRYLGEDAVILHLYTDGSRGKSINEGQVLRRTHFHFVLEKNCDNWTIAHVAIMDARL
ncbi:DUF4440 domain-containing protein [Hirschia maritima]|uniref:DUF4440 domain-containing protein n=1 Tax=Hirschia maritima TaxID=1121961 RepID=UPI000382055A|nr:DUF4440 domain-containing protein [Hirschia maritima]